MKNLFLLIILLILYSCGGFEFVHKTNTYKLALEEKTSIEVNGDSENDIRVILREIIGNNINEFPKFRLSVDSLKIETPAVINKDATVAKYNIEYKIKYQIYNFYKNCNVYGNTVATLNSYNARSAGYSFGTDLSQKETSLENINKNIGEFFSFLDSARSELNICID